MFWQKMSKGWHRAALAASAIILVAGSVLAISTPSQAHCDSAKGPVASAAHQSLSSGNVKYVLPYVKPEAEAELTSAFKDALAARKSGGKALEVADRYFIETAIRLHRFGEGAPFTGVTDEQIPSAIQAADKAMLNGSMDGVYKMLDDAMKKGVTAKYQAVVKARADATRLNTVEAHRERVEAELMFEKYIYGLYNMASGAAVEAEGQAH